MIRKLAFTALVAAAGLAAAYPASALTWPEADAICRPGLATAGYMNLPDDSGGVLHCHAKSAQFGGAKPTVAQRSAMGFDVSGVRLLKEPAPKAAPAKKAKAKAKT